MLLCWIIRPQEKLKIATWWLYLRQYHYGRRKHMLSNIIYIKFSIRLLLQAF